MDSVFVISPTWLRLICNLRIICRHAQKGTNVDFFYLVLCLRLFVFCVGDFAV